MYCKTIYLYIYMYCILIVCNYFFGHIYQNIPDASIKISSHSQDIFSTQVDRSPATVMMPLVDWKYFLWSGVLVWRAPCLVLKCPHLIGCFIFGGAVPADASRMQDRVPAEPTQLRKCLDSAAKSPLQVSR